MNRDPSGSIADAAALWVARMEDPAWSKADERALEAWMKGDPRREGALLQAQAAWLSVGQGVFTDEVPSGRRSHLGRRALLAGGGAVAAAFFGGLFWLRSGVSYRTQLGEIRSVPLNDGSTATINSGSEIAVLMEKHRRRVTLASGEAWFRVAKDPHRPFIVDAGDVTVQAVGTAFAVLRRAGGAEILVTEGVVETWASRAAGHRVRLSAGQRAFVGEDSAINVLEAGPSAVDRALAWRAGMIDLTGRSLASAVDEFNKHNRRKLVLVDPSMGREEFDGIFHLDDPAGFAETVRRSLGAFVDLSDPGTIRITPNAGKEK